MEKVLTKGATIVLWLGVFLLALEPFHAALAQSASCNQLNRSLNALNRNSDFRNLSRNTARARDLASRVQSAESQFVRSGCQRILNARQTLPRECRTLARTILSGREDVKKLNAAVQTGQAVAQQREATLQQIARFGCNANTRPPTGPISTPRGNDPFGDFLDRVFGGNSNQVIEGPDDPYFNRQTLRTVCVRTCDGYYWPVSFSTVPEFLGQDAAQCSQQCPGSQTELYYYRNPGEDADAMVNLDGVPYARLPNAFRYRKEFDKSCTCKAPVDYGRILLKAEDGGDATRAMISFANYSLPLPLRDPRRQVTTITAKATYIPLPRPRPSSEKPGSEAMQSASAIAGTRGKYKVIVSNGREVRIVGPDTPYVLAAEAGS